MDDDELLAELVATLDIIDPVPPGLRDRAVGAALWVTQHGAAVEALIAQVERREPSGLATSGMRGYDHDLDLVFEIGDSECAVTIVKTPEGVRVSGVIVPPPGDVQVIVPGGTTTTTPTDDFGRFDVELTDVLVISLGFIDERGTAVRTPLTDLY